MNSLYNISRKEVISIAVQFHQTFVIAFSLYSWLSETFFPDTEFIPGIFQYVSANAASRSVVGRRDLDEVARRNSRILDEVTHQTAK